MLWRPHGEGPSPEGGAVVPTLVITAEKVRKICGHCVITFPGHLRVEVSEHATARPLNLLPLRFEIETFCGNYRKVFSLR